MSKDKDGNWFKRHKISTVILAIIVLIIIIVAATSGGDDKGKADKTASTKKSADTSQQAGTTQAKRPLTQSVAENYCQDAGLLSKYINTKTTDIVTLSYNPYYTDSGSTDKNGYPIYVLQWDGKNKNTGDKVPFVCQVSGSDSKHVELHSLSINGSEVYGPVDTN